ncbi:hypothetical protein EXW96_13565 [Paenibacillus sp. JMULE4]|uniref:anti-sigma factor family protein n=1 Tax=Paenibacillus sp. JMULE4 TaxID=2518342 RepID=UPI001576A73A|nr:zf-HC2 domain-containing protein [Paenibacillus sp. JMULE4]NTZ18563.1 hypothetical protein [Paenibacillus sp. JMULE4]
MMCQEVIELMQRYLDRDLDETEYSRMLGHLRQCPDCTELFERLVNLSHELESLPKVTPPFSLVDAIMPKLEQLGEAGGQVPGEAWSAPIGEEKAEVETEKQTAPPPREQSKRGMRKNVREWFSFPVFGGVVAAGLAFGFFLFQQQAGPDAGGIWLGLDQKKASESAVRDSRSQAADNQGSTMSAQDQLPAQDAPNQGGTDGMDQHGATGGSGAPNESAAGADDWEEKQSLTPMAIAPKAAVPPAAHKPTSKPEEPAVSNAAPEPEPAKKPAGGSEPSAPEASGSDDRPSHGVSSTMDPTAGGGGGEPEGNPSEPAVPEVNRSKIGGPMGLLGMPEAEAPPVHQLASADGKYTAYFENARVIVRTKNGQEAYVSKYSWEDADRIDLVEWSADYKLTYAVKMHEQSRTFIVSLAEQTETETKANKN